MPTKTEKTAQIEETLERVSQLKEEGNFDEALSICETALSSAPKNFSVLRQMADIYETQEEWEKAGQTYQRIISNRPDSAFAYAKLAKVLKQQGDINGSLAAYHKAIAIKPEQPFRVYLDLAKTLTEQDQTEAAIEAYRKLVELKPSAKFQTQLGDLLQKQGNLDDAATCYNQALTIQQDAKPDAVAKYHIKLASIYLKQSRVDDAIASYRQALTVKPDLVSAHKGLGDAFQKKGWYHDAVGCYQKVNELKPDDTTMNRSLGDVMLRQGRDAEALDYYRKALA